jgi:hypothetical protein
LSVLLRSQAGPTPPELLLEEELDELLEDVPELPLDDVPLEPELDVVDPVSGFAESIRAPASTGALSVFGGSFVLVSGVGSADFVSCTSAPSPSSGDVAHAEMRATSDRTATGMRAKRRMGATLAAELYCALGRLAKETLR